jgi:hypothetical protein
MFRSTGDVAYKENMGNIHRILFYKSESNKRIRRPKCRRKNKVFMWLNTVILRCKGTLFIENRYKQGNTRQNMFNVAFRRVRELLLLWKSNQHYIFVCVCVCARARARVCVCLGAWACACVCVHVAMFIQRATRMRHIVTSFVAPVAPPYFSTLSHKRHDFRKKKKKVI